MEFLAAAIAGFFAIGGVVIGGRLASATAEKINQQQTKETRRTRKIAQLERLDRALESLSQQLSALMLQGTAFVATGKQVEAKSIPAASLVEAEFLIKVYLPESLDAFENLKANLYRSSRNVVEALASSIKADKTESSHLLAEAINAQSSFMDNLKKVRQELILSVQGLEES
jgi:hypothetical protein